MAPAPTPRCVLVADDDRDLLALGLATLGGAGYRVVTAADGAAAIAAVDAADPPVVLVTDVFMPGIDGFDLASALLESHPDLAIVFATGQPDDDVRARAAAMGRTLLVKPYTPAQLRDAVAAALAEQEPG